MSLYKKAGAKYFVSMGVHHDNFDLWNSKHTRWNAVQMGPKQDVVGMWQDARAEAGSEVRRERASLDQLQMVRVSHGADKTGPSPAFLTTAPIPGSPIFITTPTLRSSSTKGSTWTETAFPMRWKQHYFDRITGSGRQVPARPALHRWPSPVRRDTA